ncbi:MAG: anthranilate synthase component I family protein, partial [Bacteroidaceae bacterium]|nr:anthranilate synthase component I family protein [Bacteroidaceae bacterium]
MKKYVYNTASKSVLGDLHTPVSVYMTMRDIYPMSALLESSDYHGGENSRSFIGVNPIASVAIGHGKATLKFPDGKSEEKEITDSYRIEDSINEFLSAFSISGENSKFCGLYGYTSFNAVRYSENIGVKDTTAEKNDAPDLYYILYKDIVVFDHFNNTLTMVELVGEGEKSQLDKIERNINSHKRAVYNFRPVGEVTST